MENLDLNAMGVVEMSAKEVKTTDGGGNVFVDWLITEATKHIPEAFAAMVEISEEGGTTAGNIGGSK